MSFNGSGTFNINSTGQPVVANTLIESAVFNAFTADVATGLSTCITKDGQTTIIANIPMSGNRFTGLGAGVAAADSVRVAEIQSQLYTAFTTAGTSTAYTLAPAPAITAYVAGQSFDVTFHVASGAAPTLQISGIATPPNLVKQIGAGTYANIALNDIPANHRSRCTLLSATQVLVEKVTLSAAGAAPRATRIDVASVAGTVDLTTSALNTDDIRITGASAITAFTIAIGRVIRVTAGGAFTLTNNASIITQTGANIVAAAGDTFMLRATAENVVEVLNYTVAGGVPDATTSVKGKVQLATSTEAQTASDGTKAVTPLSLAAVLLGVSQGWSDQTASRAVNTTYTNTFGRSIAVHISVVISASTNAPVLTVGGITFNGSSATATNLAFVSAIIPKGATYSLSSSNVTSISQWRELS